MKEHTAWQLLTIAPFVAALTRCACVLCALHCHCRRCAGLRNPVLNIALMVGVTDIPDWCYVEAYGTQVRLS